MVAPGRVRQECALRTTVAASVCGSRLYSVLVMQAYSV